VPFDGEDSFSIGYKHIMEELPTPPLDTAEQRDLFGIVQRMMAKKPDDRFQTAEELVAALEGVPAGAGAGVADMSTMPTRAIEPVKPPTVKGGAPPMTAAATAPLPRASASMGKPADAGAAAPPAPARKGPPRPVQREKSKGPMIAAVVMIALIGAAAGGYFGVVKPKQDAAARAAADSVRADSLRRAQQLAAADSARRDSAAADSAKAPGTRPAPTTTATTAPPRPTPTPTTTTPAPPTTAVAGEGTLRFDGTIPPNATIRVAGRTLSASGGKIPAGRQQLSITAPNYQPYNATLTVVANQVMRHTVTMTASPVTTTSTTPTRDTAAPAGRATDCTRWQISTTNPGNACWDARPQPRSAPSVAAPATCRQPPQRVAVVVRVAPSGDVVGTPFMYRTSGCPALNQAAIAVAQDIAFTPAQKDGRPVEAFVITPIGVTRQ
jgi:hypothetical protein